MTELSPAIAAATIILLREVENDAPELLMVERAGKLAFAGGASVFPGGKVDADDLAIARDPALATPVADADDAAARVAAIRECLEEVGLAIGFTADVERLAEIRAALRAETPFSSLLVRHGLTLDLAALNPFTRWRPDFPGRRFDTRFYLATAPDGMAAADGEESVHVLWGSARAVLEAADAGERHIIFPTRRNLERLAQWRTPAEIHADAAAFPPADVVVSSIEMRGGEEHVCIPEGFGYPVTSEPTALAKRG